jgi:hypothetical protein
MAAGAEDVVAKATNNEIAYHANYDQIDHLILKI